MNNQPSKKSIAKLAYSRFLPAIFALIAIFFLPAGTLAYWEAWNYIAILTIPMFFVLNYLLKHDPELLERRLRTREKEVTQKRIVGVALLYFLLAFSIPGLDRRWEWSQVPLWVVLVADGFVLLGYSIFFLVIRENRYASRVIEVSAGQQVITSGPYAYVRHPMYLGITILYLASPLALGSYWAVAPMALIIPILIARIRNEEAFLKKELQGYEEYMNRVKYRLIPGIW